MAALRQVVEATLARKLTEHVERIDTDMARPPGAPPREACPVP